MCALQAAGRFYALLCSFSNASGGRDLVNRVGMVNRSSAVRASPPSQRRTRDGSSETASDSQALSKVLRKVKNLSTAQ